MCWSFRFTTTKTYKKTKDSRDEIHETHTRLDYRRNEDSLEEPDMDTTEKLAQYEQNHRIMSEG